MLFKQLLTTLICPSKHTLTLTIFSLSLLLMPPISNATLITFINEIHYDNSGGDSNEFIEIASLATTDLNDLAVLFYNGYNGEQYNDKTLSGYTFSNITNGYGFIKVAVSGIQNGPKDGIALINNDTNQVLQFLSYEGVITASNGTAKGMTSVDIGVSESSGTAKDYSLQLSGHGRFYEDFKWQEARLNTENSINSNQTFTQVPEPNGMFLLIFSLIVLIFTNKKSYISFRFNSRLKKSVIV